MQSDGAYTYVSFGSSPPGATDMRAGCGPLSTHMPRTRWWYATLMLVFLPMPGETVLRVPEQLLVTTRSARRSPTIAAALHALPGRYVVSNPVAQPATSCSLLPQAAV